MCVFRLDKNPPKKIVREKKGGKEKKGKNEGKKKGGKQNKACQRHRYAIADHHYPVSVFSFPHYLS